MHRARLLLPVVLLPVVAVTGFVDLAADAVPPRLARTELVVRRGEALVGALERAGLARREARDVAVALRSEVDPRRLRPGDRFEVVRGRDAQLIGLVYWGSPVEGFEVRAGADGWRTRRVAPPIETQVVALRGVVEDTLFQAVDRLGESPALTVALVGLFEWDFDFAADALRGDRFRLLVEKRYVGETFVGYGNILIAQYESAGLRPLTAVAFDVRPDRVRYFDADGRSVRKMFLRAPLDFTRITSGYSHARRHPVLGGVRPHLAVDYSAPTGTPVRAVADGVVEAAGWRGDNGRSIVLRHPRGYKTMYNHLSKVHVRRGARVRQRQVIGRVGSTGLSTGPHLDYRVMKDGRFVNPLSERFTPGAPVPDDRLAAFETRLAELAGQLEREVPFPPDA